MKSMTGFGRAVSGPHEVSVRAVNGRFLDVRLHLPREFAGAEAELKAVVTSTFARGTLDVYVNRSRAAGVPEIQVNTELAEKWLAGLKKLGQTLHISEAPSLEMLAKLPDVIRAEERNEPSDTELRDVKALLAEAVRACDHERLREGRALVAEIESQCARLETLAHEMSELRESANAELDKKLRDRLQKLGFDGVVNDQRIAQEIVMQLDRADITEEFTRLREHLKAYRSLLGSETPQGKKLDFYAQELLREVNTIGSKSQIAKLTGFVVDAKTIVERIREQVQNVE